MKVYTCPKEVPAPQPDYANYDRAKEDAAEEKHRADLKAWLVKQGFVGKYTGEIYSVGVADGHALYMLADVPKGYISPKSFLIHLPYGDAYQSRDVEFIPKKEIIHRIEAQKNFRAMWNRQPGKKLVDA